jgi:cytoskeletal protein RodZ
MNKSDNFGLFLKHERELRGIPLEEIAHKTKIHLRFLQALEANDFDALPAEVFIKGFIRSYTESIGGNADEVLTHYEESVGKRRHEHIQQSRKALADKEIKKEGSRRALVIVVGLVVLGAVAYWLIQQLPAASDSRPKLRASSIEPAPQAAPAIPATTDTAPENPVNALIEPQIPNATPVGEAPPVSPQPIEKQEKTLAVAKNRDTMDLLKNPLAKGETGSAPTAAAPAPEPRAENTAAVSPMALNIRTAAYSWFKLTVDEEKEFDFILSANAVKTFFGKRSFKITIGNRAGTRLDLNGAPLTLPQSEDNVVRDYLITLKKSG